MIAAATLHEIVGILNTEADYCEVAAHLAVEGHNRDYAQAKLDRAARCKAYAAEITEHLKGTPGTPGDDAITS